MKQEQSQRIQTSVLNDLEKRVLIWLAQRQPRWMTSDMLTAISVVGAIVVARYMVCRCKCRYRCTQEFFNLPLAE